MDFLTMIIYLFFIAYCALYYAQMHCSLFSAELLLFIYIYILYVHVLYSLTVSK